MAPEIFTQLLSSSPLWLTGLVVLGLMIAASWIGQRIRARLDRTVARVAAVGDSESEGQVGYIVSAVLGLLALLTGFTFSLAVERFDARRILVLEEANAIGTTYLRTQLLEEPHRSRISGMLVAYTDNRIAIATAPREKALEMVGANDALITDLWTATVAAFPTIRNLDFSSEYIESMNIVIDLDASRKAARGAKVPSAVFFVLFIYVIVAAGVLGYVLAGFRGRLAAYFLYILVTLSLLLVIDIDSPTGGGVGESQAPMLRLRDSLKAQPPEVFDRLKTPQASTSPQ